MAEKLTKDLHWRTLREKYTIGTVRVKLDGKVQLVQVNELQDAINDGELLNMLQACADELHNGELNEAVRAFRRALQSQASNMRNGKIAYGPTDKQRYELLDAYTTQFVATSGTTIAGKAKWQYTVEDIESLAGNYEELRKLYNSMMDKKSKDPDAILEVTTMEEYTERIDCVRVLRNEAKQPKASDALVTKLQAGKKLNKAETEELLKLLGK